MKDASLALRLLAALRRRIVVGGLVPTLDDFRAARLVLSSSMETRARGHAKRRR